LLIGNRRGCLGVNRKMLRLSLAFSAVLLPLCAQKPLATSQYDCARTGATLNETRLTPARVNVRGFGKLFSLVVDGDVYAQPLYVPGVNVPGKGIHNLVFIATEHNSVYAFDAGGSPREPLWRVSFTNGSGGITAVPAGDVQCPFIRPEVGITSTPVIDVPSGTLYVLARTKEKTGVFSSRYVQRLHALAITTGVEKFGGPVEIHASVPGRGAGAVNGQVAFNPLRDNPRASLLLVNGAVYLAWASSCDVGPYHGWVMAYDARTLHQRGALNVSPDAAEGGMWLSDTGPAADKEGNVYVATGNGKFDAMAGGRDYGDSVLKLRLNGSGLSIADFFTPFNERLLDREDADLGSGGPVLLPDQPGTGRRVLVVGGKAGTLYVIDRNRMGGYQAGIDAVIQKVELTGSSIFGAPAYWNGHVYLIAASDVIRDFIVKNGELTPAVSGTLPRFPDGGATPAVSANGKKDGIVWALATHGWRGGSNPAVLRAYEASNVAHELYNSEQNSARDRAGPSLRFTIPMISDGRVYVGAAGQVNVYGLLAEP
jgi:hypothetical protein